MSVLSGRPDKPPAYLGLIDEMHVAISPVLLGAGERLFEGVDLPVLGYACTQHVASARATHIVLSKG